MQYYAHRGFWRTPDERNSAGAFRRAFDHGFGVETDVRDFNGRMVISHDPPTADAMDLGDFLDLYRAHGAPGKLALNVKADGLSHAVRHALDDAGVTGYVMFDMSVPDLLSYRRDAMPFYVRRSEFESASPLDAHAAGAWLDAFERPFADEAAIREAATAVSGDIALVSPELHRRPHEGAWALWRRIEPEYADRMWLCTDFPDRAQAYFQAAG
jgi:glycerophosphoryl diester phosphodiesterase